MDQTTFFNSTLASYVKTLRFLIFSVLKRIIKSKTGLLLDQYFSSSKINWIISNVPSAKKLIKQNRILFGTIDTFLIWRLTNRQVHATDATNATNAIKRINAIIPHVRGAMHLTN